MLANIFSVKHVKNHMKAIKRANDLFSNIYRTELELLEKCIKNESFDLLDITTIWCLAFLTFL